MCGEQICASFPRYGPAGSPPRVRGTGQGHIQHHDENRITPACAGNSPSLHLHNEGRKDHPRVCGEQRPPGTPPAAPSGSPPRVRGTGMVFENVVGQTRITPACAGNSMVMKRLEALYEDHPRVCGEQRR